LSMLFVQLRIAPRNPKTPRLRAYEFSLKSKVSQGIIISSYSP